jgi:hypothetical protein
MCAHTMQDTFQLPGFTVALSMSTYTHVCYSACKEGGWVGAAFSQLCACGIGDRAGESVDEIRSQCCSYRIRMGVLIMVMCVCALQYC